MQDNQITTNGEIEALIWFERTMKKVEYDTNGGCWFWAAAVGSRPNALGQKYGQVSVGGRNAQAHRALWEHFNGPIPDGLRAQSILSKAFALASHGFTKRPRR